ncbi:hypothetical protein SynPROS71_01628 [Synechococcus sp. PROS-7-1]|nr:hypothetical protein SynPROS71_01628 [Synechococcus sp. PROS-7-1]
MAANGATHSHGMNAGASAVQRWKTALKLWKKDRALHSCRH